LVRGVRAALAGRVWFQMCNRPPASMAPMLRTCRHGGTVWALAWRPGDGTLASAGSDGCTRLWEATHGRLLAALATGSGSVNALRWSPDGRQLVLMGLPAQLLKMVGMVDGWFDAMEREEANKRLTRTAASDPDPLYRELASAMFRSGTSMESDMARAELPGAARYCRTT